MNRRRPCRAPHTFGNTVQTAEAVLKTALGERTIRFEAGRLAQQAAGSVVTYLNDDTMVLSATTASKNPKDQLDFFPLTVDVEERQYAAGKIPGSFFRREGRPSEDAILTCRLTDRPLRPSFAKGLRNEIQIVSTIMALDPDHLYDVVAINGAASQRAARRPAVHRPGRRVPASRCIDGEWVAVPDPQRARDAPSSTWSSPAACVEGGDVAIMMVEAEATENTVALVRGGAQAPTEEVVAAGPRGRQAVPQADRRGAAGARREGGQADPRVPGLPRLRRRRARRRHRRRPRRARLRADDRRQAASARPSSTGSRRSRGEARPRLRGPREGDLRGLPLADQEARPPAHHQRGRAHRRPWPGGHPSLSAEIDVVPRVHGSALFERGETQIIGVTTLNMLRMEQMVDTLNPETRKRYMHNYNFPPYSTGETGRVGSPKRREIGHGALAERALVPVLPSKEEFPYAIRAVSEALGSNGSTSMGSVCASTLSLMAAGVPLQGAGRRHRDGPDQRGRATTSPSPTSSAPRTRSATWTSRSPAPVSSSPRCSSTPSSTASPRRCSRAALQQAHEARLAILDVMAERDRRAGRDVAVRAADHHREDPGRQDRRDHRAQGQDHQPDPGRHRCRPHRRGRRHDLHRGRRRRQGRGRAARGRSIVSPQLPEVGERYLGTVVKTTTFGAFVSLTPGKDGLLHISQIRKLAGGKRVENVEDVLNVGEQGPGRDRGDRPARQAAASSRSLEDDADAAAADSPTDEPAGE